jgi:putative membrane protein
MLVRGVFWVGLLGVAVYLIKKIIEGDSSVDNQFQDKEEKTRETPLEVARKRYASGEIGKEEFKEIKRELQEE